MSTIDSDVGIERVLRPQWRFEELYTPDPASPSISGSVPILFTYPPNPVIPAFGVPDMSVVDPEASKNPPPPGISPILAKFVPCSIGSTMLIMFPIVPRVVDEATIVQRYAYVWRVVFRLRNAGDYTRRRARAPFAIGKANVGSTDTRTYTLPDRPTLAPFAGPRLVIPALTESQIFAGNPNQDEGLLNILPDQIDAPNQERNPIFGYLYSDSVAIPADNLITSFTALYPAQPVNLATPRIPMDYQQGIFDPGIGIFSDPTSGFVPSGPTHLPKFVKCLGNEFAVECFKYNLLDTGDVNYHSPRAWDFVYDQQGQVYGGQDMGFSFMFGLAAVGFNQPPPIDTGVRCLQGAFPL